MKSLKQKVLIVDDEILIRKTIINLIDWEHNGFTIAGEAFNGREAIDFIERNKVDVVILDVDMPIMNGVELSKYLKDNHHHIKMIVVSSYDDFSYVKETMKNGAYDYILKHQLNAEELLKLLGRFNTEQDNSVASRLQQEEDMENIGGVIREKYIRDLILEIQSEKNEYKQFQEYFSKHIHLTRTILLVMQIENFYMITSNFTDKDKAMFISTVTQLCKDATSDAEEVNIAYIDRGRLAFLIYFPKSRSEMDIETLMHNYNGRLKEFMKRYINLQVSFSKSALCLKPEGISGLYEKLCKSLENFANGQNEVPDFSVKNDEYITLSIDEEKDILAAISALDGKSLDETLKGIFNRAGSKKIAFQSIEILVSEIYQIAKRVMLKEGITFDNIGIDESEFLNNITDNKDLKVLQNNIFLLFNRIMVVISSKSATYSRYVQKSIEYIYENYKNDFSLEQVAEEINITPNYLSKKFKDETGMKFVEFLNIVRIRMAKKLIDEGQDNIKSIYQKVGFNNYNYFFRVFKEVEGITPVAYSKKRSQKL